MRPIICRRASATDAVDVCEVVRRSISELCIEDHCNEPDVIAAWLANKTPLKVASWIEDPDNVTLIAESDERVVACGLLKTDGRLLLFYVSPDARFQGVSKMLMRAVEAEAKAMGLGEIRLGSTATARRFYLSCGFTQTGPAQADSGAIRSFPMRKTIV